MASTNSRRTAGILTAFTLGAAMAACGGAGGAQSNDSPSELTIAVGESLGTLDPTKNYGSDQIGIENLFGGTLTRVNDTGTEALPGLAESWKAGEKQWTFQLRSDAKFSDGSPVTANDVAASLNFQRQDAAVFSYALASVSSVRAVGDRTVEVNLFTQNPRLDLGLTQPGAMIFPALEISDPKAAEEFLGDTPVSAGQYMIESRTSTSAVLKANPYYWGPSPVVPRLTFEFVSDPASRLAQLTGGEVDVATALPVQADKQLTGDLHGAWQNSSVGQGILVMNTRESAPTGDMTLRKAINAAIDRTQLSDIVYFGVNEPQLSFFPEGSPFYRPYVSAQADTSEAKTLLAESGCSSPCELSIIAPSASGNDVQAAQLIAQQLQAIGIDASVAQQDPTVFDDNVAKGNFDLAMGGTYGFYLEDDLNYALATDSGGPAYRAGWTDADSLAPKWRAAAGDEFTAIVNETLDRFEHDLPFVPLYGYGNLMGSRVPDSVFSVAPSLYYAVGASE